MICDLGHSAHDRTVEVERSSTVPTSLPETYNPRVSTADRHRPARGTRNINGSDGGRRLASGVRAVTRVGHAAKKAVLHGILSLGRPVVEYTSAVEALEDAPSRKWCSSERPTAVAVWPSRRPTCFATKKPGADAADAGMGVRALKRGTVPLTTSLVRAAGGPERLKPIVLLALVVGLQSADAGTVGALVVPLKQSLHITNTQVGLLVTVSTGVGALATLLAGALADRTVRVRLLWMTLLVCSAAMALSAVSPSYGWLLACRVALGAGVAVSGPVVA
jgi:Major Facilitator Superfamily